MRRAEPQPATRVGDLRAAIRRALPLLAILLAPLALDAQAPRRAGARSDSARATTPASSRPASRPASRPGATASRPGQKPAAAKPTAAKPTAAKPTAAKPTAARPATAPLATAVPASQPPAPRPAAPQPPAPSLPPEGALTPGRNAELRSAPGTRALGTLRPGVILRPTSRERGWVKVQVEGWVREEDVVPADTAFSAGLTAADLRVEPERHRGRVVRWEVQAVALQRADQLRRDLAPDEPYLLARGPGNEDAILYLALPPSLVETARNLPPLARVLVTARVRTGRSDPTGVPILAVQELSRR